MSNNKSQAKISPVITALIIMFGVTLAVCGIVEIVKLSDDKNTLESTVEIIDEAMDVRKYFEDRADIISVSPVAKSKNNYTETDVIAELDARGFKDFPVDANYTLDGQLDSSKVASDASSEMHPIYETYYYSSDEDLWIITIVDGTITASPASYNLNHVDKAPVLVSESEEIVSYDSSTNSFYRTIPKATVLNVIVVDRIDAQTLGSIKLEE
jgi:hypothetical protein